VILPLGGDSLIGDQRDSELNEITRLSDSVFAVIDSERATDGAQVPANRKAFAATCERLGFKCAVLKRRAIENYFTDRAVKIAFGPKYAALGEYESPSEASLRWGKSRNWRAAQAMTRAELDETDLGEFLSTI